MFHTHTRVTGAGQEDVTMKNTKRIFFDSGRVLVYPASGEWMFPVVYKEYCQKNKLKEKTLHLRLNYKRAMNFLHRMKSVTDENQEYTLFQQFYRKVFHGIKGKDNQTLIDACANGKVFDYDKYRFFDDVKPSIERLAGTYKLGLISDAWPSLANVFKKQNLFDYFNPFIISSMYGHTKEGYELFRIALKSIDEKPEECLFIDDAYGNCRRARETGMAVLRLERNKKQKRKSAIPVVRSIPEVEKFLEAMLG
jgi:putative hydrolase of the HAD superfamily